MWTAVPPAKSTTPGAGQQPSPLPSSSVAAEVEHPVRDREVDERHPDGDEDAPRHELRAVGDRAAISAGVMIANISWNIANTSIGIG